MWFDVSAALAALDPAPAEIPAIPAIQPRPESQNSGNRNASALAPVDLDPAEAAVVAALRLGCVRPGVIATRSGLGGTATYQALDRLLASGRVAQARDGTLSEIGDANP